MENQQKLDSRLVNWTKEEKFMLYEELNRCKDSKDTFMFDSIIGKNEKEIKDAIQFYKERHRLSSLKQKSAQKCHRNKEPSTSLDSWANFLVNSYGSEDLKTEIATAFRLIAYFESKPPAACTENIDFRKVYLTIADAIEGKPIQCDPSIKCLLNKCATETALTSKAFIKSPKYKNIIKSINTTERVTSSFVKPTANMELATLRHLLNQTSFNPLNLTEDCLIPSVQP